MLLSECNRILFRNVPYFSLVSFSLTFQVAGLAQSTTAKQTSLLSGSNDTNDTTNTAVMDDELKKINLTSMTVGGIGMLCNTLLILVIIVDPLRILRRGAWVTILNLSLADLLACLSHFVRVLLNHTEKNEEYELTIKEFTFIWMFSVGASFMFLSLLTAQMYIIIKYPMKSRLTLTTMRVALACLVVWVLAFPLGLSEIAHVWMQRMEVLYFYVANIAVLELAVAIQIVLKILIIVEILKSRRVSLCANTQNQKQKDVAKTVIILIIILIVTALPFFVALQISFLSRLGHLGEDPLLEKFRYYYEPIGLLNYVANPILYSLRLQDYRRTLLALFKFNCKKRARSTSTSSQPITRRQRSRSSRVELTKLSSTKRDKGLSQK